MWFFVKSVWFSLVENEGAKILCDQLSYQFLKGATIEFADSLMRSAFQVRCIVQTFEV